VIQDVDSVSFYLCVLLTERCERTSLWNFYVFCVVWRVQFSRTIGANLSIKRMSFKTQIGKQDKIDFS
jgi:hypothetical protein